jgi:ATP-binding cassette subfamily B protein
VVKSFEAEDMVTDNAKKLQNDNYIIKRKRNTLSVISSSAFSFVFMLGYTFGLVWGAYNIVQGNITYGVLTEIVSLISQIQGPISGLTSLFPTYFAATASAERIMEIENLPNEKNVNEKINVKETYNKLKFIVFDNITFSYDRDIILDNTSLKIDKGDFVAIMGITGIGKSTLMKLLMSVFKLDSGSIYLDTVDKNKIYVDKSLRKMFAYVPQGNFLLSGTIRENITFVCPDATDEEIYKVLDLACARDFVDKLPQGLETKLGERGVGLSEGQVQRLAIARALLTEAPILLLDECTSALDEETEKLLLTNLKELKNKTCIIITHKKAALAICNKEVCIEDKKIITKATD